MHNRQRILPVMIGAFALFAFAAGRAIPASDMDRGRSLYEMRCMQCHDRSVHSRTQRTARDYEAVRAQIGRAHV